MAKRALVLLATAALAAVLFGTAAAAPKPDAQAVQSKKAVTAKEIETVAPKFELKVAPGRSKVLRAGADIRRTAVVDARVAEVVLVAPRELMILGKAVGKSDVTIWVGDKTPEPVVMVVHVASD